jgi:hypothetical protein
MKISYSLKHCCFAVLFAIVCNSHLSAQQTADSADNNTFDHFTGVQANLLLRQILSFNDPGEINNPYLLKYTLKHRSGIALNIAAGFNSVSEETGGGIISNSDQVDLRVGLGYQKKVGKFEIGVGADVIFSDLDQQTFSSQVITSSQGIDSSLTSTGKSVEGFGYGLQGSVSFYLTPNILIGTETSLRYIKTTDKLNTYIERYFIQGNEIITAMQTNENDLIEAKSYTIQIPVAIFLIAKF